jgi:hypothetical protein
MSLRVAVIAGRLILAAAALAGVTTQLVISAGLGFDLVSFFSYFTILSNLFGSVVFIVGAVRLIRRVPPTRTDDAIRGASVVYLAFVGIVFGALLQDVDLGALQPWINVVHHMIMPAAVVLDWIIWPPRSRLSVRAALAWMIFPAAYVIYSLVRGAATGFYAYPFFNPDANGGYGGVALYCVALIVVFVTLAFAVRWIGNLGQRRTARDHPEATRQAL